MKLLVSIHDVTPAFDAEVRALWRLCADRGVTPALLVVPDWHGAWPLEEYPGFVGWLRARARDGAEVFLHGMRHDEAALSRNWLDELRAFGRTDGEGEFLTLAEDAARARISLGLGRLRAVGLDPVGFVAPAWLWRGDSRSAVTKAGLRVSEDDRAIYLHARGVRLASPVLRWSARSAIRAWASACVAEAQSWRHRDHWLVRIAFHPRDLTHPATDRSARRTLDRWVAVRHPWRYTNL